MPKLKNVEEVANRLEPIFTQSDAYEFDNGYSSLIPAIELAKQVITQDRQAIREVLKSKVEEIGAYELDERGNPLLRKQDILALINELLGGEVTEDNIK